METSTFRRTLAFSANENFPELITRTIERNETFGAGDFEFNKANLIFAFHEIPLTCRTKDVHRVRFWQHKTGDFRRFRLGSSWGRSTPGHCGTCYRSGKQGMFRNVQQPYRNQTQRMYERNESENICWIPPKKLIPDSPVADPNWSPLYNTFSYVCL